MSTRALVTMICILGFVWGGLLLILATAIRKERDKRADPEAGAA